MSTERLFKEKQPRQERSIRRKADDFTILFTPEIGFRDGELDLPKGIVSGQTAQDGAPRAREGPGLPRLRPAADPVSRRSRPTSSTARPSSSARASSPTSIRASMSVPGLIDPAEIGGKLLVDGGLTDNLPVGVARAMGADVVIAVNLGTPLMKREELNSILGVTGQMINILTEQNVRTSLASLKPTDILDPARARRVLRRRLRHLPKTIPIGEAAARRWPIVIAYSACRPPSTRRCASASSRSPRRPAPGGRDPLPEARRGSIRRWPRPSHGDAPREPIDADDARSRHAAACTARTTSST